jgi:hypothetical protein
MHIICCRAWPTYMRSSSGSLDPLRIQALLWEFARRARGSDTPARNGSPYDQQAKTSKQQVADFMGYFNGAGSQVSVRPRLTYRRKMLENQV